MSEVKLTKTQLALKERVERAKELYEKFYQEYHGKYEWQKRQIDAYICAQLQTEFCVSERKAMEYLRLAKMLKNPPKFQQNT